MQRATRLRLGPTLTIWHVQPKLHCINTIKHDISQPLPRLGSSLQPLTPLPSQVHITAQLRMIYDTIFNAPSQRNQRFDLFYPCLYADLRLNALLCSYVLNPFFLLFPLLNRHKLCQAVSGLLWTGVRRCRSHDSRRFEVDSSPSWVRVRRRTTGERARIVSHRSKGVHLQLIILVNQVADKIHHRLSSFHINQGRDRQWRG